MNRKNIQKITYVLAVVLTFISTTIYAQDGGDKGIRKVTQMVTSYLYGNTFL